MKNKPIIVILGNTVLIEGVLVSLKNQENLCIYRIENPGPDLDACLRSMLPNLIIFELDDPGLGDYFDFLKETSEISFIGLDRKSSQVIVVNSYQRNTGSMQDFIQFIHDVVR